MVVIEVIIIVLIAVAVGGVILGIIKYRKSHEERTELLEDFEAMCVVEYGNNKTVYLRHNELEVWNRLPSKTKKAIYREQERMIRRGLLKKVVGRDGQVRLVDFKEVKDKTNGSRSGRATG